MYVSIEQLKYKQITKVTYNNIQDIQNIRNLRNIHSKYSKSSKYAFKNSECTFKNSKYIKIIYLKIRNILK